MKGTFEYDHNKEEIHAALGIKMEGKAFAKKLTDLTMQTVLTKTKSEGLALIIEKADSLEEAVVMAFLLGRNSAMMDKIMGRE